MEIWATKPHPRHAIANCSQTVGPMLLSGEYKQVFLFFFAKFLWSLFIAYANNLALDTVWCLLGNLAGLYVRNKYSQMFIRPLLGYSDGDT